MGTVISIEDHCPKDPEGNFLDHVSDKVLFKFRSFRRSVRRERFLNLMAEFATTVEGHVTVGTPKGDAAFVCLLAKMEQVIDDYCVRENLERRQVVAELPIYMRLRHLAEPKGVSVVRWVIRLISCAVVVYLVLHFGFHKF